MENKPVDHKIAEALGMNIPEISTIEDKILEELKITDPVVEIVDNEEFVTDVLPTTPETGISTVRIPPQPPERTQAPDDPTDIIALSEDSQEERLLDRDFNETRKRLKRLVERGEEMFEDAYRFAQENQAPSCYQVAGELFKSVVAANDKLLKTHEDRGRIKKDSSAKKSQDKPSTVNNNLFVGTTSELMKALSEYQKEAKPKEPEVNDNIV